MKSNDQDKSYSDNSNVNNEPKVENDYVNHTEIDTPNPSTATPSIPDEIPSR